MGFFNDFKTSLMQGDILSLATAVVIGAAFGGVVTSAVNDLLMPIIGLITGGLDFTKKFISLNGQEYATLAEAKTAGASVLTYGNFIQALINFILIALFIFSILRTSERMKKKEAKVPVDSKPALSAQEVLLTEIRDVLKSK
ncbi:MAG TPA: large conductance mechanosensitive channel protein MscL [Flavobacterium sp.]|jgi:large conductance mechanosensitive channel